VKTKFRTNYKAEADRIAAERGGRCLTLEIPTTKFKAIWKCSKSNHPEWRASFGSVKGDRTSTGTWCDRCFRERLRQMLRLSIDQVRKRLRKLGIELISKKYTGINNLITCRCLRCKFVWPTRLRHINHGHGCPECGNRKLAEKKRKPTDQIITRLKTLGLTVHDVHHETPDTQVSFSCDTCGLEDMRPWKNLRRRGCPECGNRRSRDAQRFTYDYVKKYMGDRRTKLLSKSYRNSKAKLDVLFEECGCEGKISFNSFQQGERCGNCRINARVTVEDHRELAAIHQGSLEAMAATVNQPAKWKCRKGHNFPRPYSNIQQSGTFCPNCSERLSERICRAAAEQLFGKPFEKTPLRGARGVGGRPLRFDAYNEFLKLAVEHNGQQHYQPTRFGNQTEEKAITCFRKQQEHDRRRRKFCAANGITLIEVPELGRKTKIEDLKDFIRVECQKANFKLPARFDKVHLKLAAHHLATTSEEMWERVLKRTQETGYTLKTKNYPGAHGRLSFLCRNLHDYTPTLASFLNGHTCRRCWIQHRAVPVVILPLGKKMESFNANARIFDSIEDCAKAMNANSNNVRIVAKGRGKSCLGFGVAQITTEQSKRFRESKEELENFCRIKWPLAENYDRQDGARKSHSKPVRFSDGHEFPSKVAAAKFLGVSKATIYYAVRTGSPCKGRVIQAQVD